MSPRANALRPASVRRCRRADADAIVLEARDAELPLVSMRLLEVIADHLVELGRPLPGVTFDPCGESPV